MEEELLRPGLYPGGAAPGYRGALRVQLRLPQPNPGEGHSGRHVTGMAG